MTMVRRNVENIMLKAFEEAVLDSEIQTLAINLIKSLKKERFFYLTHNPEHYRVGGRIAETGEYQFYVKYDGFKYDERFKDLDFDDVDYIETKITVVDVMPFIVGTIAFDYTDASLYMLNLEQTVLDLVKEVKRGN